MSSRPALRRNGRDAMHRALSVETEPDGMTWQQWRLRTVRMAVTYLTIDQSPAPDRP
ncbi:hypothetical protein [Nocardia brasiliensis]|uniref:hypothetical protein n=1 Tax=Nocardia brasiliensis TaxID=37326 RepID=UPI003D8BA866